MALLPTDPKQRNLMLIGVLGLIVPAGAYSYLVHGKQKAKVAELESRYEQLETKNAQARGRAAQGGPDLQKKLAIFEQHMTRLEQLIPSGEEVPELLHAMALRAQETNVEVGRLRPDLATPGPFYTRQTYEVVVIGAYHDIGRFLAAIGSLPRIVTPIELQVGSPRKETDPKTGARRLEATFKIKTYVLPSPTPAAPPAPASAQT
ncbi:MAG: type 4a pilus biogenesis protein PilO [Gemmatimonadetes bacterium]|nr:type 4a pilus biogenesis protein PilO [Gemmatimonadota bacterium]